MKKFILLIALACSVAFGASAMTLKEAFDALSNMPDVSAKTDYDSHIPGFIANGQQATAKNLDATQILKSGNAALTILSQVPLSHMINGGNNGYVCAFVYASPKASDGLFEVLILLMSGKDGDISAIYGDIDTAAKTALQNATLHMEGSRISIHASLPDGYTYNIKAD